MLNPAESLDTPRPQLLPCRIAPFILCKGETITRNTAGAGADIRPSLLLLNVSERRSRIDENGRGLSPCKWFSLERGNSFHNLFQRSLAWITDVILNRGEDLISNVLCSLLSLLFCCAWLAGWVRIINRKIALSWLFFKTISIVFNHF